LRGSRAITKFLATIAALLLAALLTTAVLADDSAATNECKAEAMVVFINARTCPICARVRPILADLENKYKEKVRFVRLDVTDTKDKQDSRKVAKSLRLGAFFAFYEDTYPCVGIFDEKGKCLKEIYGFNSREKYVFAINRALRVR
jgi:thiol-disulfide isomerase/thioredoxin